MKQEGLTQTEIDIMHEEITNRRLMENESEQNLNDTETDGFQNFLAFNSILDNESFYINSSYDFDTISSSPTTDYSLVVDSDENSLIRMPTSISQEAQMPQDILDQHIRRVIQEIEGRYINEEESIRNGRLVFVTEEEEKEEKGREKFMNLKNKYRI